MQRPSSLAVTPPLRTSPSLKPTTAPITTTTSSRRLQLPLRECLLSLLKSPRPERFILSGHLQTAPTDRTRPSSATPPDCPLKVNLTTPRVLWLNTLQPETQQTPAVRSLTRKSSQSPCVRPPTASDHFFNAALLSSGDKEATVVKEREGKKEGTSDEKTESSAEDKEE